MLTGPHVLLALKVAVGAVSVLLVASLVALARGKVRLHGRINIAFFALTMTALVAFEAVLRITHPGILDDFLADEGWFARLRVHLCFAVPSAVLMPAMLFTGLTRRRRLHIALGIVFGVLWTLTFITGVFFLPHER